DALTHGALTAKQREIIALAIAQVNGCHYCLSAHTLMGKGAGLSPDGIRKAREGRADAPVDEALTAFARAVAEARGQVSDADIAAARLAGLTDAHLVEVIANVALNVLTNFTNNVSQTEIDFPKVELALAA
ncbi:MAG: carboxymuconolactone decarboxylase family protein, partial [Sphingomonadaceae bacterium]|nr:carboxymuconolactone decarboxylase family protein [Sphingomonadaceae bacterium]